MERKGRDIKKKKRKGRKYMDGRGIDFCPLGENLNLPPYSELR